MDFKHTPLPEFEIDRSSLKDQAAQHLRSLIISGRIPAGSKITERDVAAMLKISRMPARDALMTLEQEGLITSRLDARYVIELQEVDIRQLYEIRVALEKLAVELAILRTTSGKQAELLAKLDEMRAAVHQGDAPRYTTSDLELHQMLWQQAENPYLLKMLTSMIGPIFMLIYAQSRIIEDWQASLLLHEELVKTIREQDQAAAARSIEKHIVHSLDLALRALQH
jgi:DNA-binding GntR family transcriptional regulator